MKRIEIIDENELKFEAIILTDAPVLVLYLHEEPLIFEECTDDLPTAYYKWIKKS